VQSPRFDRLTNEERKPAMFYPVAVILVVLWYLGFVTSHTLGGFIQILLMIAGIAAFFRIISGRSVDKTISSAHSFPRRK